MSEQGMINEALEKYLGSTFSYESRQKVINEYGEEIALKVSAIYEDAMHAPVDWRTATIDSALPHLHDLLDKKYPWLSAMPAGK